MRKTETAWQADAFQKGIDDADAGKLTDLQAVKRKWQGKESGTERTNRLNACPSGRALLAFLSSYDSHAQVARLLDLAPTVIAQWLIRGKISRTGARLAEERLGIMKETLRPDITPEGWSLGTPGRLPGATVARDNHDQLTLTELVKHYGSVRQFCAAAGITIGQFHNWLSRGRIAAWIMPRLCNLDVPEKIKGMLLREPE